MHSGRSETWGLQPGSHQSGRVWRGAEKCSDFWLYIHFTEGKSISLHPSALVSYGFLLQGDQGSDMSLLNWKQLNPKGFFFCKMSKALYYLMPWGEGIQPSISCATWQPAKGTITTAIANQAQWVGIQCYLHILNCFVKRGSIKTRFSKTWGFLLGAMLEEEVANSEGASKILQKIISHWSVLWCTLICPASHALIDLGSQSCFLPPLEGDLIPSKSCKTSAARLHFSEEECKIIWRNTAAEFDPGWTR